ncbi:hypothetical protein HDU83_004104 [Entophlyctis luteolus]|nr:hypothetical protein HDU83_004104 [Entophlyctis luteolus]
MQEEQPEVYTRFEPWKFKIPADPAFKDMRDALCSLCELQFVDMHPQKCLENIYPALNVLEPFKLTDETNEFFNDEKFMLSEEDLTQENQLRLLLHQVTKKGVAVITALGGMGKSTLAKQFARFMMGEKIQEKTCPIKKPQYQKVFLVRCETEAQAFSDLETIFKATGDSLLAKTVDFLEHNHRYLFIIDDLNDITIADKMFKECQKFGGDVVITTRLDPLPSAKIVSKLGVSDQSYTRLMSWPLQTTREYLLKSCPRLSDVIEITEENNAFENIVKRIDGYPIVISQFISYYQREIPTMVEVENDFERLLNSSTGDSEASCLRAMVEMSLQKSNTPQLKKAVEHVFFAVSFLEPSSIQQPLLKQLVENLQKENLCSTDLSANQILKNMVGYGLLRQRNPFIFFTHSLMQEVAAVSINTNVNGIKTIVAETIIQVLGVDPYSQFQFDIGIHIHHFSKNHIASPYQNSWEIEIDRLSGLLLIYKGLFQQAREILESCLNRSESFYGTKNHVDVALTLSKLGNCSLAQTKYSDAIHFYNEAIDVFESNYGRQHDTVATILRSLGMVANAEDRYEEAEIFLEESLEIFKKAYVAATLNNLGNTFRQQKLYKKAMECYKESLLIKVEIFKTREHTSVATNLHNMGKLYFLQGEYTEALLNLNECKAIRQKIFKDRHPEYAMVLEDISDVKAALFELADAHEGYSKVYSVYAEVYGEENERTRRVKDKRDKIGASSARSCVLL